jgi:hypothetical protein
LTARPAGADLASSLRLSRIERMHVRHVLVSLLAVASCGGTLDNGCPDWDPPTLADDSAILLDPDAAVFRETAPDTFRVRFVTTRGDVVVEAVRNWSPLGVDRFYNLVRLGYFRDIAFYRVIPGFVGE